MIEYCQKCVSDYELDVDMLNEMGQQGWILADTHKFTWSGTPTDGPEPIVPTIYGIRAIFYRHVAAEVGP